MTGEEFYRSKMFGQEEIPRSRPGYELEADTCQTWADMAAGAILLDEGDVIFGTCALDEELEMA